MKVVVDFKGISPVALLSFVLPASASIPPFISSSGSDHYILLLCLKTNKVSHLTIVQGNIQPWQILKKSLFSIAHWSVLWRMKEKQKTKKNPLGVAPVRSHINQHQWRDGGISSKFPPPTPKKGTQELDLEKHFVLCSTLWWVNYSLKDLKKNKALNFKLRTSF